jgi:hypothetical protein
MRGAWDALTSLLISGGWHVERETIQNTIFGEHVAGIRRMPRGRRPSQLSPLDHRRAAGGPNLLSALRDENRRRFHRIRYKNSQAACCQS